MAKVQIQQILIIPGRPQLCCSVQGRVEDCVYTTPTRITPCHNTEHDAKVRMDHSGSPMPVYPRSKQYMDAWRPQTRWNAHRPVTGGILYSHFQLVARNLSHTVDTMHFLALSHNYLRSALILSAQIHVRAFNYFITSTSHFSISKFASIFIEIRGRYCANWTAFHTKTNYLHVHL
jgi:hypothetical protein